MAKSGRCELAGPGTAADGRCSGPLRLLVVAVVAVVLLDPQVALAKQPTAVGRGGGAATVDELGTKAAIDTLRRGGNAVDAAVAAAAVLGVTEPYSCGIGGGGFMVIRTPNGRVTTIDSREESPASMQPDSFQENGAPLPFDDARYSGLSAGVPGTVAGWERALDRYGSWPLRRVLRPGIRVARHGFEVDQTFVDQTTPNVDFFDDIPSTAAIYLDPDGTPRDVGSTLREPRPRPDLPSARPRGRPRASTAATSRERWSTRRRTRPPGPAPTTSGARAS